MRDIKEIKRLIEVYPPRWRRWCNGPERGGCACMGCVRVPAPSTVRGDPEGKPFPRPSDRLSEADVEAYLALEVLCHLCSEPVDFSINGAGWGHDLADPAAPIICAKCAGNLPSHVAKVREWSNPYALVALLGGEREQRLEDARATVRRWDAEPKKVDGDRSWQPPAALDPQWLPVRLFMQYRHLRHRANPAEEIPVWEDLIEHNPTEAQVWRDLAEYVAALARK